MTSINLRYNGVHTELIYYVLASLGYTKEELASLGYHIPYLTLSSRETTDSLYQFLVSEAVYQQVYSILLEHKAKGLHYTLQCFTDYLSNDVGSLYKTPTDDEMGQAWDHIMQMVVPELGEVLITLEYR